MGAYRDCASTREWAEARCGLCDEPIGYGVRFYRVNAREEEADVYTTGSTLQAFDYSYQLAHARCVEERIDP